MKKLVLIDSNALVHRAFHALPPLSSPLGQPTNAVYGFAALLLKMIADVKPDYIAATFDLAGATFRHQEYEAYKAHRVKAPDELYAQIPVVKRMLGAFGIPVYACEGYEADDVIGSISEQAKNISDLQTIIVTGDLDTLQLIHGNRVVVFTLRKGMTDTVIYDEDAVRERYGIAPAQVPDLKGLKGDPSDNIPGVPGIGEKTAATLIQEFGNLEALYEKLEAIRVGSKGTQKVSERTRARLLENRDIAFFSKKLATIILDVQTDFSLDAADWRTHTDIGALEALCRELGFSSLANRISAVLGKTIRIAPEQSLHLNGATAASASAVRMVTRDEDLPKGEVASVHAVLEQGEVQALYVTTDGTKVFGLAAPNAQRVQDILLQYATLIGHDLKSLLKALPDPEAFAGHTVLDTALAGWLINPESRDYPLERVYAEMTSRTLSPHAESLPLALWELRPLLWDRMKSLAVLGVFTDIEMPLVAILAAMENRGILVDTKKLGELLVIATEDVGKLERQIHKLAGRNFNINSPAQLSEVLFTTLGLRGRVRRTGGGALSTAASELEKLRDEHPIVGLVLEYRELNKLKTTYIEPFPSLVHTDGRIHTTYHQTGTATGRLSSSDPNLQNIPTRTDLGQQFRAAFIAPEGWQLLSLDYSQLELRVVAHIAHDETMTEAFRAGEDIHTRTASEVFGLAPGQVTSQMRRQAKVLNFGIIYGMGVMGFAHAAGVSRDTAKRFIDEYFARFHGVARYMEHTKEEAARDGFVSTLLGRRRPLPDIHSRIPQLAAQAERMAINHPIQGTGADIMKLAMISVDRHIRQEKWGDRMRMLLQVHDELVLEVRADAAAGAVAQLVPIMERAYSLDVPLIVDAKIGAHWAHMERLSHG